MRCTELPQTLPAAVLARYGPGNRVVEQPCISLDASRSPPSRRRISVYRIYVGQGKNYRVIYRIRNEVLLVVVLKVGDRKEVYRRVK